jgi:dTDP-4-dehydrorhamnose reductase
MRILVTGVTGQVGRALVHRLQGAATILAADRTILDLTKPLAIPEILDRLKPDVIVNPAAYTAVEKAEDERELATCVNGVAPGAMAQWAAARDVPFIHFSTDYVFNGFGERAWSEDDEPGPLNVYGASKLAGETAVRTAGGYFLILRTSWIYGATGNNFLRTISRLALEREELRIVADQIGAPTSSAQLADTLKNIMSGGTEKLRAHCKKAEGLVHFAASGETSWYGFACAIVDGLRSRGQQFTVKRIIPIGSDESLTRAKRPRNSRLDLSRIQYVFGITPLHWEAALAAELDLLAHQASSH